VEAGTESQSNDLRDDRDRILADLSKKMDISYYENDQGMIVVRGPKQSHLVEGGHSAKVETGIVDGDVKKLGIFVTDFEGQNSRKISDAIQGGTVGGLVQLRDQVIPTLIDRNNEMAVALTESFNAVHQQGFGVKGYAETTGRDFFAPIADIKTAAQDIGLHAAILESTDAISAASSPNAPGDNVIINRLVSIKDLGMMDGNASLREFYGNVVGAMGLDVVRAKHLSEADHSVLADLSTRREAISGVSLDEEATNLLKWQACFSASSKVITTVDEMLDTVLSLKR
jgi:flagellar hook-associated protein 1 FlgK